MAKYRKKPVIIDAIQLTPDICWEYWTFDRKIFDQFTVSGIFHPRDKHITEAFVYIETLEGNMKATLNDWIIKGVNGEFYRCKPDIFEKSYEPVEEYSQKTKGE